MHAAKGRPGRLGRAPLVMLGLLLLPGCKRATPHADSVMSESATPDPRVAAIIARESARLLALPGVHGVAEGRTKDGRPCVMLLADPGMESKLPREIDGVPVTVLASGPIRALDDSASGDSAR